MLKTNNKKVNESFQEHVLEYFSKYDLKNEVENLKGWGGISTDAQACKKIVEGGGLLCYISDCRDFIQYALEESKDEADSYSEERVWSLYVTLTTRAMTKLLKGV